MREDDTRPIPYARWEIDWARDRPPPHRTPIPAPGDEVMYRHDSWGPVVRAEVVSVQPLDDLADENLAAVDLDGFGNPIMLEGRAVITMKSDPWPVLRLTVPGVGLVDTREARLRGSPGWLPLDWTMRTRPNPTASQTASQIGL